MEHRCGQRIDTSTDVSLFGHPWARGRGRIRDISMTGAFVQTCLRLPALALLDIELHLNVPDADVTYRIAATVVRTDSDGLGLEWCEPLSAEFIQRLTRGHSGAGPGRNPLIAGGCPADRRVSL